MIVDRFVLIISIIDLNNDQIIVNVVSKMRKIYKLSKYGRYSIKETHLCIYQIYITMLIYRRINWIGK